MTWNTEMQTCVTVALLSGDYNCLVRGRAAGKEVEVISPSITVSFECMYSNCIMKMTMISAKCQIKCMISTIIDNSVSR